MKIKIIIIASYCCIVISIEINYWNLYVCRFLLQFNGVEKKKSIKNPIKWKFTDHCYVY